MKLDLECFFEFALIPGMVFAGVMVREVGRGNIRHGFGIYPYDLSRIGSVQSWWRGVRKKSPTFRASSSAWDGFWARRGRGAMAAHEEYPSMWLSSHEQFRYHRGVRCCDEIYFFFGRPGALAVIPVSLRLRWPMQTTPSSLFLRMW